jgi:hypothetical protein
MFPRNTTNELGIFMDVNERLFSLKAHGLWMVVFFRFQLAHFSWDE